MKKIIMLLIIGLILIVGVTADILSNRESAITEARDRKTEINTALDIAINSMIIGDLISVLDVETEQETDYYRWVEFTFEGETKRISVNHLNEKNDLELDTPLIKQQINRTIIKYLGDTVEYES